MLSLPDIVRRLTLSDYQINLVRLVQKQGFGLTTEALSYEYNITTQNASSQLRKLWERGYLNRVNVGDGTGGTVYKYTLSAAVEGLEILQR